MGSHDHGCRRSNQDYLYKDEWPQYEAELGDKFEYRVALSREPPYKPDGSKIYVQDLIWDDREAIADEILR
jgi:NADPH-ferrihemoprotein reductase